MSLILTTKEYAFNDDFVFQSNDKKQKDKYPIKVTTDEMQWIKEVQRRALNEEEITLEDEKKCQKIIWKDNLEIVLNKHGKFHVEEATFMIVNAMLGKLANERIKNANSAIGIYQNREQRRKK